MMVDMVKYCYFFVLVEIKGLFFNEQIFEEVFFYIDYRLLMRDVNNYVLDEQI